MRKKDKIAQEKQENIHRSIDQKWPSSSSSLKDTSNVICGKYFQLLSLVVRLLVLTRCIQKKIMKMWFLGCLKTI